MQQELTTAGALRVMLVTLGTLAALVVRAGNARLVSMLIVLGLVALVAMGSFRAL